MRKTEEDSEEDWPEFAKGPGREEIKDDLFEILKNKPAALNADGDAREGVQEYLGLRSEETLKSHVRSFHSYITATASYNTNICSFQTRRVINTVTLGISSG